MYSFTRCINMFQYWDKLSELNTARVRVLLEDAYPLRDAMVPGVLWKVRFIGPRLALLGLLFEFNNKTFLDERAEGAADHGVLTRDHLEWAQFQDLDRPFYPFITTVRAGRDGFRTDASPIYRMALQAGLQLELRTEGTIALRGVTNLATRAAVNNFLKAYKELNDE